LGKPFDELYELQYPQLSWYVHSGITGVANLQAGTFALMAGICFTIVLESYVQILEALINEYKIYHADDRLKKKLDLARSCHLPTLKERRKRLRAPFLRRRP